jgi:hypothetical protein
MVGSVYMPKQKQPTYNPKPDYKPTHTLTPAGLPSVIVEKPFKAKYDPTVRLQNQAAQERMEAIMANYVSDSDQAAHLLQKTAAALKAARELHEMERLSAMGLNHGQINELMEKRLAGVSHRHGALHDHHTEVLEQISLLANSRGRPKEKLKQPLSTREGLMTPQLNFTQKEINKVKHGLLHFAEAKTASHLEKLQKKEDKTTHAAHEVNAGGADSIGRYEASERMKALPQPKHHTAQPEVPVHLTPRAPTQSPLQMSRFTSPATMMTPVRREPLSMSTVFPTPATSPGAAAFPMPIEYAMMSTKDQKAHREALRGYLSNKGIGFGASAKYASLYKAIPK